MPILPNENRAVLMSLEQAEGLPEGVLQGVAEKRTGWRPNLNLLPDFMLPEEERGENKTEMEVMAQNLAASKALKSDIDYFNGNTALGVHAFLNGVGKTEEAIKTGFSQNEIDDLYDVARRSKEIVGSTVTPEEEQVFVAEIGQPSKKVIEKKRSPAPTPTQPISLKRTENGRYFTGNDLFDAIITIESKGDTNAVSPTGATGIFQFTRGTAKQYGLIKGNNDMRRDPQASLLAMKKLTKDNSNILRKNGVPITPTTIYLAHQQGAGGAVQIWKAANGQGKLSSKVRQNMAHNWGSDKSAAEYLALTERKVSEALGKPANTPMPLNLQAGVETTEVQPIQQTAQAQEQPKAPDYIQQAELPEANTTATNNQAEPPPTEQSSIQKYSEMTNAGGNSLPKVAQPEFAKSKVDIEQPNWNQVAKQVFGTGGSESIAPKRVSGAIKGAIKGIV